MCMCTDISMSKPESKYIQPRVHIRGDAMRVASFLEARTTPGLVHVSDSFLRTLCALGNLEFAREVALPLGWYLAGTQEHAPSYAEGDSNVQRAAAQGTAGRKQEQTGPSKRGGVWRSFALERHCMSLESSVHNMHSESRKLQL